MISEPEPNLDDLLNDIKSKYKTSDSSQSHPQMNTDNEFQADDYLKSIKDRYKNKSEDIVTKGDRQAIDNIKSELKASKKATDSSSQTTSNASQADDYLNSIKAQYKKPSSTQNSQIDNIKSQLKNQHQPTINNPQINNSLDSFKDSYQSKKEWQKSQEKLSYSRNKEEIILQEQQKQLKQKQLTRQAQHWLAKLDPYSEEGMWFDQLAESYPSRLDAAMSYLSTLNQSDL